MGRERNLPFSVEWVGARCRTPPLLLIPLDVALRLASLVPLQVLQDAGGGANRKVVVAPAAERRDAGGHVEAVQVARDGAGSLRDLFRLEVIAGVEGERPVVGNLEVARHIDVMRVPVRIAHRVRVNRLAAVFGDVERIVQV